ncbi:MAG TPA: nucleotidyl transferase AbiEii/AbiGii toxin family protein [Planctomycetota bacterium]|nr:nucleotidyl transferase AbiEii/AbiGii toxin family protein [Planctomycetota bacterium]
MAETAPDFETILRRLQEKNVEFVLIGGLAAIYHGHSRVTFDIDICYARNKNNLKALASVLIDLGAKLRGVPVDLPFKPDARTLKNGLNFTFLTDHGDLDVLGEVSGVGGYNECAADASIDTVAGVSVRILSLERLISAKKAAGRPKDLNDLQALLTLKEIADRTKRP